MGVLVTVVAEVLSYLVRDERWAVWVCEYVSSVFRNQTVFELSDQLPPLRLLCGLGVRACNWHKTG